MKKYNNFVIATDEEINKIVSDWGKKYFATLSGKLDVRAELGFELRESSEHTAISFAIKVCADPKQNLAPLKEVLHTLFRDYEPAEHYAEGSFADLAMNPIKQVDWFKLWRNYYYDPRREEVLGRIPGCICSRIIAEEAGLWFVPTFAESYKDNSLILSDGPMVDYVSTEGDSVPYSSYEDLVRIFKQNGYDIARFCPAVIATTVTGETIIAVDPKDDKCDDVSHLFLQNGYTVKHPTN